MTVQHEIPAGSSMPPTLGAYSNVVRAGDFLFVSGQFGLRPTREIAGADFATEARQAFENLSNTLRAAGSGIDRVVKITVCLADVTTFSTLSELFAAFFPNKPPAQSCIVALLPYELRISIDCIALA